MWWFRRNNLQVRALGHCRVVHFPLLPLLTTTTFRRQWIFLKWVKLPFRFLVTSYFIEGRNIQMQWTQLHSLQNRTNCVDCNQLFMSFYELWVLESRLKGHRGCICHGTTSNPVCRSSWHKNSTLAVFTKEKKCHTPHPTKTEPSFRKPYITRYAFSTHLYRPQNYGCKPTPCHCPYTGAKLHTFPLAHKCAELTRPKSHPCTEATFAKNCVMTSVFQDLCVE